MAPALQDITTALTRQPGHPLATHVMIHMTEGATPGGSDSVPAKLGYAGEDCGYSLSEKIYHYLLLLSLYIFLRPRTGCDHVTVISALLTTLQIKRTGGTQACY